MLNLSYGRGCGGVPVRWYSSFISSAMSASRRAWKPQPAGDKRSVTLNENDLKVLRPAYRFDEPHMSKVLPRSKLGRLHLSIWMCASKRSTGRRLLHRASSLREKVCAVTSQSGLQALPSFASRRSLLSL